MNMCIGEKRKTKENGVDKEDLAGRNVLLTVAFGCVRQLRRKLWTYSYWLRLGVGGIS